MIIILLALLSCSTNLSDYSSKKKTGKQQQLAQENILNGAEAIQPKDSTIEHGKLIRKILCKADPSISYSIYFPKQDSTKQLPIVFFFDPHGDGSLPLNKYKDLADKLDFIMVGSNNSKNGNSFQLAQDIWDKTFQDVRNRISFNSNQIFVDGFSGGAKVATYLALKNNNIKGVIAGGAALDVIARVHHFQFNYIQISGDGNMNLTQMMNVHQILGDGNTQHQMLFFNGTHSWAPKETMYFALFAMVHSQKNSAFNDETYSDLILKAKNEYHNYLSKKSYSKAANFCSFACSVLPKKSKDWAWFKENEGKILKSNAYQAEKVAKFKIHQKEEALMEDFQQHFAPNMQSYWNVTILKVQQEAKANNRDGAMYKRLNAYLSLAFYSLTNRLIQQKQYSLAKYYDDFYKSVDPTNSEAWYFSALINANQNNLTQVAADLSKAVSLGFNDKNRLLQEPVFQSSEIQPKVIAIAEKLQ